MDFLYHVTKLNQIYKLIGEYLKIITNNVDDFCRLQSHFTDKNTSFKTLDLQFNRIQRAVICGLSVSTSLDFILEDLKFKCFKPTSACHTKKRLTKQPMPLFLILVENAPNFGDIYKISDIHNLYIKVERLHGKSVK